jgi:excisionase family DNA binding protein
VNDLLTSREVAELFRVSTETIYRWGRQGTLDPVTVGGTIRFRRTDVEALLASGAA